MDNQNASPILTAPVSATILSAKDFAAELLSLCQAHDHIMVDVDQVAQADLCFIQIIHAAQQQMRDKGGTLSLARPVGNYLSDLLNKAGFSSDSSEADFWFNGAISQ